MEPHPAPSDTTVKICGITREDDATWVRDAGADFLGVIVEVDVSLRSVPRESAVELLAPGIGVGLTYDAPVDLCVFLDRGAGPAALQLAGTESVEMVARVVDAVSCEVWKSLHVQPGATPMSIESTLNEIDAYMRVGVAAIVLDTAVAQGGTLRRGGTGTTHNWEAAALVVEASPLPVILAGGLCLDNVRAAIEQTAPAGVDVSSGVELTPGVKDRQRIRAFVEAVRSG